MISINPVFAVLVTSGNQNIAAAGIEVFSLLSGQLGFFDYNTGLSIDAAAAATAKNIFIAVGKDGTADGQPSVDVMRSAGNSIKKIGFRAATSKDYVAGANQKFTINIGKIVPDKDYNVKFEIRNQEAYANFGYNLPSKNFPMIGGPVADPNTGLASTNDFIAELAADINGDDENFLSAVVVGLTGTTPVLTPSTTGGTLAAGAHTYRVVGVTADGTTLPGVSVSATTTGATGSVSATFPAITGVTGYRLYRGTTATNHSSYLTGTTTTILDDGAAGTAGTVPTTNTSELTDSLVVEILPLVPNPSSGVANLMFQSPIQTVSILSMVDFGVDTTWAETQAVVFEQQSGRDIIQQEYEAGGFNGNPGIYRASDTVYLKPFKSYATANGTYDSIIITNDNIGIGGGEEYGSSCMTSIVIPAADNTTSTAVKAVIEALYGPITPQSQTTAK